MNGNAPAGKIRKPNWHDRLEKAVPFLAAALLILAGLAHSTGNCRPTGPGRRSGLPSNLSPSGLSLWQWG